MYFKNSKFLNYKDNLLERFILDQSNFVIHPNETLYFEYYINLPFGNDIGNYRLDLDSKKEYFAEISMFSDSTDIKKMLPRNVLKEIKENDYEVYLGVIRSKNRIPIKFVK